MRHTKLLLAISFWFLLAAVSCNRDDINFDSPTQLLRFSKDTVFCDTVYNQVRSETYAVKIYNDEDKDLMIPAISLENGAASLYRINVDGKPGKAFKDVPLRKKDSLYIFVEIAPTASATEAIAEDRIIISTSAGPQQITLFSVVQDAEFFIESAANPNLLNENTTWTADKAKIIFGNLRLAEGRTLTIEEGVKVYFHKNSGLKISKNAELKVQGSRGKEVIFRGDRNDARYDTIPKNWKGIALEENASLAMNYAKVMGGTRGLSLDNATANIRNSIFHTHQEFGIYAINSVVNASNLVMNNSGNADFGIFKGGTYNLTHCTLANYWNFNSALPALGLYAANEYSNGPIMEQAPLNLSVKNSIIYNESNAVVFKPTAGQIFNYNFKNSFLRYGSAAGYTVDASNITGKDPKFQHYYTHKMNLRVKDDSPAKGKADPAVAATLPLDIAEVSRISSPTIGAYQ